MDKISKQLAAKELALKYLIFISVCDIIAIL